MRELLNLNIRPIEQRDAAAMHAMRIMPGVQETISGIFSERLPFAEDFVKSLGPNDHHFVAEVLSENNYIVVGSAGLAINPKPRKRHMAVVGVMVHTDWQKKGIGRMLLDRLIDLSDNWLLLKRLELTVFASNDHAIRLYKSLGFETEGTIRSATAMHGSYVDELIMSRIR